MASVGAVEKAVEKLRQGLQGVTDTLEKLQQAEQGQEEQGKALGALKRELAGLEREAEAAVPLVDKFASKLDQKDPITGTLRYGDSARKRIVDLRDGLPLLCAELAEAGARLGGAVEIGGAEGPVTGPVKAGLQAGPLRSLDADFNFKQGEVNLNSKKTGGVGGEGEGAEGGLEARAGQVRQRRAAGAASRMDQQAQVGPWDPKYYFMHHTTPQLSSATTGTATTTRGILI
ncbi:hypothetical protein B484DRAFT_43928 [Ochromonadaceae sp. CCMP2298]|nr:hypothetical protein B484DRAFT_43928 [Ochromonadaceae sp. CCMP2298]